MRRLALSICLLCFAGIPAVANADDHPEGPTIAFPGERGQWHGFDRYQFDVGGREVTVVTPDRIASGKPWVWHGEFFGHKPAPDIELLKRGFHVVYLKVPNLLGAPEAVDHWTRCYETMTKKFGLARTVSLVGLSRGGLYCYNWAAANPDRVACIYGDAPVCDFKSWPGGRGTGKGSPRDWKLVLEKYGFETEAEALAYDKNPVDNLRPLVDAGVPILHVYGDADQVVPWEENTGLLASRYKELGGKIKLIGKPGVGHHPHGLDDPTPIVEFILEHGWRDPSISASWKDAGFQIGKTGQSPTGYRYLVFRNSFDPALNGSVPGFAAREWKDGMLDSVTAPKHDFGIFLFQSGVTNVSLQQLSRFEHLHTLHVGNSKVSDAGLHWLVPLKNLRRLSLYASRRVSDKGLAELTQLTELRFLNLGRTEVSDAGMPLVATLTKLRTLDLTNADISDAGINQLEPLTNLTCLTLNQTYVTDASMNRLAKLYKLKALNLVDTAISDRGIESLSGLKEIEELVLVRTKLTDEGMSTFADFKRLRSLALSGTKITDAGLQSLIDSRELKYLGVQDTSVTPEGVKKLKRALPELTVFTSFEKDR